ncbi:uncharacterized protein LOC124291289 [Haliotis rubra]|uniref:uncharacterized protein LOC124291289 n=1 Tax=Haliotis rubra TaxID=36100 RepID=UPI001EE4FA3A|nr:uncharacterized protein LOC124291289 [Haliotis rubra]
MAACSASDGVNKFGFPTKVDDVTSGGSISGLAASRRHVGFIYAVSDVATVNVVRVLNLEGQVVGNITISNAINVDWEDAAVGNCVFNTSTTCLYIMDAGDSTIPPANIIYIVQEPAAITGMQSVTTDMMIDFNGWNNGDCCTETLFVDSDANMYFFSREPRGVNIGLYKLINNDGTWGTQRETVVTLPSTNTGPDGADLSPSGEELLVLFHDTVYHFHVANNDVKAALTDAASLLPSVPDPSGTSIAWATDTCGYYTSTEEDIPVLRFSDRVAADVSRAARFNFGKVVGQINSPSHGDVTGIAFSKDHPGYIYAINSGTTGQTFITVFQTSNGYVVSVILLFSATNTDWQDIAVGPRTSGGQNYIYILDGGEANGGPARTIIMVPEPDNIRVSQVIDVSADNIFVYNMPVGVSHALAVTSSGRIFITNYQDTYEETVTMYQLVNTDPQTLLPVEIGSFPHQSSQSGPESLDVAPDNSFILVKNSDGVLLFPVKDNDFPTAITNVNVTRLPYVAETNGFSVAIAPDSNSYYTFSNDQPPKLKRYDAISACAKSSSPPPGYVPRNRLRYRVPPRPRYPILYKSRGETRQPARYV